MRNRVIEAMNEQAMRIGDSYWQLIEGKLRRFAHFGGSAMNDLLRLRKLPAISAFILFV